MKRKRTVDISTKLNVLHLSIMVASKKIDERAEWKKRIISLRLKESMFGNIDRNDRRCTCKCLYTWPTVTHDNSDRERKKEAGNMFLKR